MATDHLAVAAIAGPHGVRGQFKVKLFAESPDALVNYGPLHIDDGRALKLAIKSVNAKGLVVVSADGINSREAAEKLRGMLLSTVRANLPDPAEDELYHADILGAAALAAAAPCPGPRIYLSPRGRLLDQPLVRELAAAPGAVFLCGRYEGVDQRVIDAANMMEVSIGDYVLSGGETAALTVMDAVIRLLPGVMGKEAGHREESFETGLLEHSHYTQPRIWNGMEAPAILASGHHRKIAEWRQAEAEKETQTRRPDMWQRYIDRQHLHKGKR